MNNNKLLPSFFVVGGQKCGTTTLHNWLNQERFISLPDYKETHYFSRDYSKGINWYLNQFTNNDYNIRGEVDPSYMFFPNALERIKEDIKNPKFIFIFRKPIDRSYSHYLMSYSRGYEKLSFLDAIKEEKKRLKHDVDKFSFSNHSYLLRSEYSSQIEEYYKLYEKKQSLFLKFDDLFDDKKNKLMYNDICRFLKIQSSTNVNFNIKSNKASFYKNSYLRDNMYNETILRGLLKKIIFSKKIRIKIRNTIDNLNRKAIDSKSMKENKNRIMDSLPSTYKDWNNKEVLKLEKITQLKLDNWII